MHSADMFYNKLIILTKAVNINDTILLLYAYFLCFSKAGYLILSFFITEIIYNSEVCLSLHFSLFHQRLSEYILPCPMLQLDRKDRSGILLLPQLQGSCILLC